jgi:hypothetical protein
MKDLKYFNLSLNAVAIESELMEAAAKTEMAQRAGQNECRQYMTARPKK